MRPKCFMERLHTRNGSRSPLPRTHRPRLKTPGTPPPSRATQLQPTLSPWSPQPNTLHAPYTEPTPTIRPVPRLAGEVLHCTVPNTQGSWDGCPGDLSYSPLGAGHLPDWPSSAPPDQQLSPFPLPPSPSRHPWVQLSDILEAKYPGLLTMATLPLQ